MILTADLSRTLWRQLVVRLTFMCGDPTYLKLRCGSGATPGAVAYDDPDLRQSVRTAANYFVDEATNAPSRLNAAEIGARLVTDCRRQKYVYTPEPWSDGDVLAQYYDAIAAC